LKSHRGPKTKLHFLFFNKLPGSFSTYMWAYARKNCKSNNSLGTVKCIASSK